MVRTFGWIVPLLATAAMAGTEGWENVCPERTLPKPVKELWRAPLEKGIGAFEVSWRDGATGEVTVVRTKKGPVLRIAKRNALGHVVVTAKDILSAEAGAKLRASAGCEARNADAEYCQAFLAVWGGRERLSYDASCTPQGRGGQKQTSLANTPPGMPDRKLAHCTVKEASSVSAAIVVAGAPSTSVWSEWTVEDFKAADAAWWTRVRNRRPPATALKPKEMSDDEFDAAALAGPDHTAKVVKKDGIARLLVDGEAKPPVFFKGSVEAAVRGFYGGAKMAAAGMDLQSVHVRLGKPKLSGQGKGFWSKDGFDAVGAVAELRKGMKLAPKAKYLLSVDVSAYPEFCDEHPDETWVNNEGRRVFGHQVHSPYTLPKEMGPGHWYWVSNHSVLWREAAKACLTALVAELKRTGLSRMIVGVHIAGYHDAQFATVHPDYSKPAIAAFRRWLPKKYGTLAALRKAWRDEKVTFETATPPVLHYNYCQHSYFIPGEDQPVADYYAFLKKGPFFMQEDFSRHLKRLFAKDIVTVRYCMSAFGGTYNAAYDITPFLESDTVDILCAQPSYPRRVPGVASGGGLPLDSFHRHGKLFFNEFDLRTYAAMTGWESEIASLTYSNATDDPMWCAINRKLAGQMYAKRMGWWYLDMAGGWFEPDGIAADIGGTLEIGRRLEARKPSAWRPDVAQVIDEDGALLRNILSQYFNPDEETLMGRQMCVLAGAGVPQDGWMLKDWLEDPSLADRYRTIVFRGLNDIDDRRAALLKRLSAKGRTLVFLAGTGVSRGVEKLGFALGTRPFPACHETVAEPGVKWTMNSLLHESKITGLLGVTNGWPVQLSSPLRFFVREAPEQKVLARFTQDGTAAVVERTAGGCKYVYVAAFGGLSADYFHHLAEESGAYVPTDGHGLEVDMSGDFLSVHCLRGGHYDFRLPFAAKVTNLKTGREMPEAVTSIPMDLTAGETRWYGLGRP